MRRRMFIATGLAGFAGLMSAPLWGGTWFDSHEGTRYVLRLIEYRHLLAAGHLWPRWAPDFGRTGSPFFDFFPPGLFLVSAPLALVFSVPVALKLATMLFTVLGAVGLYELVRRETLRQDGALIAAAIFTFAPYRFVDLFIRGDLAEYAAITFVPWALLGYRELSRAANLRRAVCLAAIAHAAVFLAHPAIGEWTAVVALPLMLRRPLAAVTAGALAVLLAGIYLFPALAEKHLASFGGFGQGYYDYRLHFVSLPELFDAAFTFGGDFIPAGHRMPFYVGTPLIVALAIFAGSGATSTKERWMALGVLALALLVTPAAEWIYRLIPGGSDIQFPWRLLGFVAAVGALFCGIVWARVVTQWRWTFAVGALLVIIADAHRYGRVTNYLATEDVPSTVDDVRRLAGDSTASNSDEYTLASPDAARQLQRQTPVRLFAGIGSGAAFAAAVAGML